jgi:hypothetical protein
VGDLPTVGIAGGVREHCVVSYRLPDDWIQPEVLTGFGALDPDLIGDGCIRIHPQDGNRYLRCDSPPAGR